MKVKAIAIFILCTFTFLTWASEPSPVVMLEKNSSAIIQALQSNQATIRRNAKVVYGIVDRIFVRPHVDLTLMSRRALGPNDWNKASVSQRNQFSREFADLLIYTYAGALAQYTGEEVKYFPIRGGYAGKTSVQVDSVILRPSGPKIPVSYKLVLHSDNDWKVYDMTVEGISLVNSFRSQFSRELAQGGMENLIKRLQQHNAKFRQ